MSRKHNTDPRMKRWVGVANVPPCKERKLTKAAPDGICFTVLSIKMLTSVPARKATKVSMPLQPRKSPLSVPSISSGLSRNVAMENPPSRAQMIARLE